MSENTFVVYNASAGSGKTFTLVKSYLKALFVSNDTAKYKRLLAITFTNKAVAEMKGRILDNLKAFSSPEILLSDVSDAIKEAQQMFVPIVDELQISQENLHKKAIKIQEAILNNYAAFDVVTIDTFTHRLIRTFAHDLKLPQNFEVALDTDDVLQEAISKVLSKVGEDDQLTKLLIDFATQKADDDKSWDISLDLYKVSKLLLNENEVKHLELLKDKTLDDFEILKKTLSEKLKITVESLVSIAKNRLSDFEQKGISESDIKSVYGYFSKLAKEDFKLNYDAVWQTKLVTGSAIYPKRVTADIASVIDNCQAEIAADFEKTKQLFYEIAFIRNFQKNIVPLSVLNVVNKELQGIKEEQNILLISEFNQIITNEIKDQPAPFIYERLGERYQNYFIDEFQDTSQMQWQNLIPLAENVLASEPKEKEKNSLMIVGDAKQAIYRWRGGKPEQFIELYEGDNPFYVKSEIANLDTNYRSYSEVIDFNNNFFSFLSERFQNKTHQELYKIGNKQNQNSKRGGFVKISFVENVVEAEATELYQEQVLETIQTVLKQGFRKADICIVTRKKKDGIAIADYLTEQKINIISSETLLLSKSKEVRFLISFLSYLLYPDNKTFKVELLRYLYEKTEISDSEHEFYKQFTNLSSDDFFTQLTKLHHFQFDDTAVQTLPFYELVEQIIRAFHLVENSDAYVQYFLDEVQSFSQKKNTGIQGFLEYWDLKKEKLSIVAPDGDDAITLMTIHKSKGLEFPVIIVPFAEQDIYKEQDSKVWFPIDEKDYNGFSEAFLHFNKDIENYSEIGTELWNARREQLELDNVNLLYVALTRPKEQLYIISKKNITAKGEENTNFFSGFFISYLKHIGQWQDDVDTYEFGDVTKQSSMTEIKSPKELGFISSSRLDHNLSVLTKSGFLWDSDQQEAIEKGNLIHLVLSKIKTTNDVAIAFQELIVEGVLNASQAEDLQPYINTIVSNSDVSIYFNDALQIYNERPILHQSGQMLIPDRIVVDKNKATIIDYKTGAYDIKHEQQVNRYADALIDMNFEIHKKLVVYLGEEIKIIEVCS